MIAQWGAAGVTPRWFRRMARVLILDRYNSEPSKRKVIRHEGQDPRRARPRRAKPRLSDQLAQAAPRDPHRGGPHRCPHASGRDRRRHLRCGREGGLIAIE